MNLHRRITHLPKNNLQKHAACSSLQPCTMDAGGEDHICTGFISSEWMDSGEGVKIALLRLVVDLLAAIRSPAAHLADGRRDAAHEAAGAAGVAAEVHGPARRPVPGRLQLAPLLVVAAAGRRPRRHHQRRDAAAAEGAGRQRLGLRRRVGLGVAAQRQRARRAHLVTALPDLDAARMLEADAAHLRVASLHTCGC